MNTWRGITSAILLASLVQLTMAASKKHTHTQADDKEDDTIPYDFDDSMMIWTGFIGLLASLIFFAAQWMKIQVSPLID